MATVPPKAKRSGSPDGVNPIWDRMVAVMLGTMLASAVAMLIWVLAFEAR